MRKKTLRNFHPFNRNFLGRLLWETKYKQAETCSWAERQDVYEFWTKRALVYTFDALFSFRIDALFTKLIIFLSVCLSPIRALRFFLTLSICISYRLYFSCCLALFFPSLSLFPRNALSFIIHTFRATLVLASSFRWDFPSSLIMWSAVGFIVLHKYNCISQCNLYCVRAYWNRECGT